MILVCGEALIDLVPASAGDEPAYVARAGGSSFNVAMGLGRLGAPVGFLGRISTDRFGRMLRGRLEADGVDCSLVEDGDEPTTLAVVQIEAGSEPVYVFYGEGTADRMFSTDHPPADLPDEVTAIHLGSISMVREPGASAFEAVMRREHGRRVLTLDPNVRPSLVGERSALPPAPGGLGLPGRRRQGQPGGPRMALPGGGTGRRGRGVAGARPRPRGRDEGP